MKLTLNHARTVLLFILTAIAFFTLGLWASEHGIRVGQQSGLPSVTISRDLPPGKQTLDFALFWEVWDRLHHDYFGKESLSTQELIYGAIKGMVGAAGDPYTTFLPPSEQKRTIEDLQGSFEGVGIQIGFKGSQLAVIAPLKGSPADREGVEAGDFIVWIKDEKRGVDKSTIGVALPDAVDAIRGPAGTKVTLTLTREGISDSFEKTLLREKIDVPSVEVSFEGDIAHLKLLRFGDSTDAEWDRAVATIVSRQAKGIVLDLRNNPGGYLSGSVYFSSEFIRNGTVVIQENAFGERTNFPVNRRGKLTTVPLVVLVNKGSASASEIVAGALRDYDRAKLVGETTFGKGTIQEAQELSGGAGLHITTARWLTPNGTWVNEKGLEPDIVVEDDQETEEDEQFEKAAEELKKVIQ